ncbi:MAG: NADH-quinone oxidoreductase subunit NuoB [Desulfovibrio sp.]|nr:NADH-quinone oxidoreductase subunit NuoB [Desulfovibrio sp.]
MFGIIKERFHQKYRTLDFPAKEPFLPGRFKGRPEIKAINCANCHICQDLCPTEAIQHIDGHPAIDLGRCTFCGACAQCCPQKAIAFGRNYHVASADRKALLVKAGDSAAFPTPQALTKPLFRRSLKLRQVSCGGCAACEADTNVLGTLLYDLGRFGIDFVASPRHADGILVTGPVTKNMAPALFDTYRAVPDPRIVIAVGSCAISGGLFATSSQCLGGIPEEIPVDLFVPGCPPNPWSILAGLLELQKNR